MDYIEWMEESKRDVVKRALGSVAGEGLKVPHHFYITFRTQFPGVQMPESLRKHYTEEMTIVLNDAFWDLVVQDDFFSVNLMFDNKKQNVRVVFKALVSFIDPGVEFALQFNWEAVAPSCEADNVIFLDQFRQTT